MIKNKLNKKKLLFLSVSAAVFVGVIVKIFFLPADKEAAEEPFITLYLKQQNKIIELKLEEYVVGTVAAEMPASFELEALKAQAVCARTYAIRKIIEGTKYPLNADLSDDIYTCQAYISAAEFIQRNPERSEFFLKKIKKAVKETRGEIMFFGGQPIDALYHSTCGGRTESAADIWGQDIPYLRSVDCEYCSGTKYYSTLQVFSVQDINRLLGENGNSEISVRVIEKTDSGRLKKLEVNGHLLSGEKFRKMLNLPSTFCNFKIDNDNLVINSRGYGHGLGMCQYGANGMAKEGKTYKDILKKYYQNFEFVKLDY